MNKPIIFLGSSMAMTMFVEAADHMGIPIHGIIDKDYYGNTDTLHELPVIDSEECFDNAEKLNYYRDNFQFFVAVNPLPMQDATTTRNREKRYRLIDLVKQHNLECATLISKMTSISPKSTIGKNVFIGNLVTAEPYVSVGDFTNIWGLLVIGHHAQIGENCCIQRHTDVYGSAKIGNDVHLSGFSGIVEECSIGDGAWIQPGIRVHRDVKPGEIVGFTRESLRRTTPFLGSGQSG